MLPETHFLVPFAVGLILYKAGIIPWQLALVAGILGVLIDLDHYFEHVLHAKKNRFSLLATWNTSIHTHRFIQRSFIHEEIGIVLVTLLVVLLFFVSATTSIIVALSYYSHLLLDIKSLEKRKVLHLRFGRIYIAESFYGIVFDSFAIIVMVTALAL